MGLSVYDSMYMHLCVVMSFCNQMMGNGYFSYWYQREKKTLQITGLVKIGKKHCPLNLTLPLHYQS